VAEYATQLVRGSSNCAGPAEKILKLHVQQAAGQMPMLIHAAGTRSRSWRKAATAFGGMLAGTGLSQAVALGSGNPAEITPQAIAFAFFLVGIGGPMMMYDIVAAE
jgi:hypothetical protein